MSDIISDSNGKCLSTFGQSLEKDLLVPIAEYPLTLHISTAFSPPVKCKQMFEVATANMCVYD